MVELDKTKAGISKLCQPLYPLVGRRRSFSEKIKIKNKASQNPGTDSNSIDTPLRTLSVILLRFNAMNIPVPIPIHIVIAIARKDKRNVIGSLRAISSPTSLLSKKEVPRFP